MIVRALAFVGILYGAAKMLGKGASSLLNNDGKPVAGVRSATVDNRDYEVFRRGGGTYEIVRRDDPSTWLMFGQQGELDSHGDNTLLVIMREDMRKFPADLFA